MKTRTDFVSNSSSSSFILSQFGLICLLSKGDIVEALSSIYDKDVFEAYDVNVEEDRKNLMQRHSNLLDVWYANGCELDPIEDTLTRSLKYYKFIKMCQNIQSIYNINGLFGEYPDDIDSLTMFVPTEEKQPTGMYGYDAPVPDYIKTFLKDAKKRSGVLSYRDLMGRPEARFFIHFSEK